ncbi:23S rRNA-specific endonuclease VapC20 [bacterium HR07]|uniref:Ribonuclease VapC n=1 Tax=Acetithermum autotrophicum TaxID=1446466 RepID=H5SRA1_ACEAU|nr:PilT domain protein [Candidatus Acetothermum autotrophicum]GBC75922.1 23S rRNA-specific endonuclease VapC20 [bacterium HR07]
MERVFVDTSGWYALVDAQDAHHKIAKAWLTRNTLPLITTDYVFDETVTLIRMELGHTPALEFGEKLRASSWAQLLVVTPEDRHQAWEIFKKFQDQRFSFTDCTSFAVMQRLGLRQVLTVDRHFQVMGFRPVI